MSFREDLILIFQQLKLFLNFFFNNCHIINYGEKKSVEGHGQNGLWIESMLALFMWTIYDAISPLTPRLEIKLFNFMVQDFSLPFSFFLYFFFSKFKN